MNAVELLAPAKDLPTGIAAIDCGADAVYVGPSRFSAREAADNSLADIEALARHAHRYWARVYAAVNTILRDDELDEAVRLCHDLAAAGTRAHARRWQHILAQRPGCRHLGRSQRR